MKYIIKLLCLLFSFNCCYAQTVNITGGSWATSITSGLISEAGNDYTNTVATSGVSQNQADIRGVNGFSSWQVSVSKVDVDWNSGLSVWIRKTGDGDSGVAGSSITPTGSTAFMQLTSTPQYIFGGVKNRNNVPFQYEIRGISVTIPVKTYSTTIMYTISAL